MAIKVSEMVVVGLTYRGSGHISYKSVDMEGRIALTAEEVSQFAALAYRILEGRHQSIKDSVAVIDTPMLAAPVELKHVERDEWGDDVPF